MFPDTHQQLHLCQKCFNLACMGKDVEQNAYFFIRKLKICLHVWLVKALKMHAQLDLHFWARSPCSDNFFAWHLQGVCEFAFSAIKATNGFMGQFDILYVCQGIAYNYWWTFAVWCRDRPYKSKINSKENCCKFVISKVISLQGAIYKVINPVSYNMSSIL